jgi:hypothetical protein
VALTGLMSIKKITKSNKDKVAEMVKMMGEIIMHNDQDRQQCYEYISAIACSENHTGNIFDNFKAYLEFNFEGLHIQILQTYSILIQNLSNPRQLRRSQSHHIVRLHSQPLHHEHDHQLSLSLRK